MNKLTLILLFACTLIQAQPRTPGFIDRIPEPVKVLTIFTTSIVLDAVGDGLYDNGDKTAGHAFQAASTGLLVLSPLFLNMDKDNFWWYIVSYVSLRIAIFDYTYNATRGLPLGYTGSTALTDKVWGKFNPPEGHIFFPKAIFFTLGIVVPIKELR